jgi:hypothetical protein
VTEQNFRQTLDLSRQGQINDRFTKAIEQLGAVDQGGKKKLEVRLGGIYALEQIAKASRDHHWPIVEVLTAYVREHAPWRPEDIPPLAGELRSKPAPDIQAILTVLGSKPAPDIQAILTVLGRRTRTFGKGENQCIDLAGTALRGADLSGADLEGADLRGAHLEEANLAEACLEGANLAGAHLEGADLAGACLEGTDLAGAHLEGMRNLTFEQLATVSTLYGARLDLPLLQWIQQQYPHLLETSSTPSW